MSGAPAASMPELHMGWRPSPLADRPRPTPCTWAQVAFIGSACRHRRATPSAHPPPPAACSSNRSASSARPLPSLDCHARRLTLDDKFALCRSVGEECIQEEELRRMLEKKPHIVAYDGFEPSGRMHIAQARAGCVEAALAHCCTHTRCMRLSGWPAGRRQLPAATAGCRCCRGPCPRRCQLVATFCRCRACSRR